MNSSTTTPRYGFSLVETTFATLLVSLLLVTSLSSLAQVARVTTLPSYQARAAELAQYYASEICGKPFVCPDCGTESIGPGSTTPPRTTWDDCDDYDGLSLTTLTDEIGNTIPGTNGWRLDVDVAFVRPGTPETKQANVSDLKLIEILLTDPAGTTHTFKALRSRFGTLQLPQSADLFPGTDIHLTVEGESHTIRARHMNQLTH